MDEDLDRMSREQLMNEVKTLRQGIREHRDSTRHELCWHHPALWGLLPEKTDPIPVVPDWPQFLQGCLRYRQSLDEQLPDAPRTKKPYQAPGSGESSKQTVLAAYAALNAGDAAGYFGRMADDVEITYFGSHRFSRTFRGKPDIMKHFVPLFRERLEGSIKLHVKNAIAEGDQVVVEARGESRTKDGRDYNNLCCIVIKLRDGKIAVVREYMDTELTKNVFG